MEGTDFRNRQAQADHWREISALFEKCVELEPEDRESLLRSLEDTSGNLVARVRELLRDHDRTDHSILGRPAVFDAGSLDVGPDGPGSAPSSAYAKTPVSDKHVARRWRLAFAIPNAVVLAFYCFVATLMFRYGQHSVETGWDASPTESNWVVTEVSPAGPANGHLQVGDRIVAVNALQMDAVTLSAALATVAAGQQYTLRISRAGHVTDVGLVSSVVIDKTVPGTVATAVLVSIPFVIAAMLLTFFKPQSRVARLGYAGLILTGMATLRVGAGAYLGFLQGPVLSLYAVLFLCDGLHLAAAYHFYCAFFGELRDSPKFNASVPLIYVWALIACSSRLISTGAVNVPILARHVGWESAIHSAVTPMYLVVPLASWLVIGRSYRSVLNPDARRRARGVVFGAVAGLAPHVLFRIVLFAADYGWQPLAPDTHVFWRRIALIATDLVPFSTAYAVLRHQTFDIAIVIRRGLQYLLLKRVLQILLLMPCFALLMSILAHSESTVADAVWRNGWTLTLMLCISVILLLRKRLAENLDRQFDRESYDGEKILLSLVESLGKASSIDQAVESVAKEVESALRPSRFITMLGDQSRHWMTMVYDSNPAQMRPVLASQSALVYCLEETATGEEVATLAGRLSSQADIERLTAAGLEFVVPVLARTAELTGMFLLGRKLSDAEYTEKDRKLLRGIACQFAIALEKIELASRVQKQEQSWTKVQVRLSDAGSLTRVCSVCNRCFDARETECSFDGSLLKPTLAIPRIIRQRYRLESFVGEGAMGAVYKALDLSLSRPVALKVISAERLVNPTAVKRVQREARAAAQLNHVNIVAIHDMGDLCTGDKYFVLEYVDGRTLRATLSNGDTNLRDVALWFDQLFDGLQAAHAKGIVHRDLKPENLLITSGSGGGSTLKILDFGIAKLAECCESAALTTPGTLIGSLNYMAPEQIWCEPADERSDIYSAGVILYECVVGPLPFAGQTHRRRLITIEEDSFRFPPPNDSEQLLYGAIRKCLATNARDRFASAAEARAALTPLLLLASDARESPRV